MLVQITTGCGPASIRAPVRNASSSSGGLELPGNPTMTWTRSPGLRGRGQLFDKVRRAAAVAAHPWPGSEDVLEGHVVIVGDTGICAARWPGSATAWSLPAAGRTAPGSAGTAAHWLQQILQLTLTPGQILAKEVGSLGPEHDFPNLPSCSANQRASSRLRGWGQGSDSGRQRDGANVQRRSPGGDLQRRHRAGATRSATASARTPVRAGQRNGPRGHGRVRAAGEIGSDGGRSSGCRRRTVAVDDVGQQFGEESG